MNKINKILVILLVLVMCMMAFVACNNDGPSTDGGTGDGGSGDGGNGDGGNDGGYTPPVFGDNDYAQVYVTTGTKSKLMTRDTSLKFGDYDDTSYNTAVYVDLEDTKQNFYGYGASLTHSSAYLLMQEGAEDVRKEMLNELFGPEGARFNFVRVPIGASDYIEEDKFFTCCDLAPGEEDPGLLSFNLDHDQNLIAVLKEIVAINPNINIIAVPWSAPAWMKTTGNLLGGSLEEKYESVFADYLVKFVKEYKKHGINITHLSLVNEPFVPILKYPTMQMDGVQAASIVKHLGPKLEKLDHKVKILGWDHNVNNIGDYLYELYDDEEAGKYVAGAAFHGYAGDYTDVFTEEGLNLLEIYTVKEVYLSDITEHSGSKDFARYIGYAAQQVSVAPLNLGSNGAMFWNYVLRSDGTPTHNSSICYGVMDMDYIDGEYIYDKNSAYYAMAHVSKFAYEVNGQAPKALYTESSNDAMIIACALYRADGAIIITACNVNDSLSETVDIVIGEKSITYTVQPQSIVTFVYNPKENGTTETEFYQAYNVTDVYMEQKTMDSYLYKVKSDIAITDSTKVYVSPYATLSADAEAIAYTKENDALVFNARVPYDSYFIHVVDGEKSASIPMAKPMCAPTLSKVKGENPSNVVTYNFVAGTSWSSFCDPMGKAVYRSAKGKFDETAEVVAKNVQISGVDSTTDTAPDASKPYYYVVLTSKNGVVTFVSAPLIDYDTAFSNVEVKVENQGGRAVLVVEGTFNVAGSAAIDVYSADEKLGSVTEIIGEFVSGEAGERFRATLDFTSIIKAAGAGIWYDVKLATGTGLLLEIPAATANTANVVQIDRTTIKFESWNDVLKLTYAFYDVSVSSVIIDESDATRGPVLIVTGIMANGVREVKLHADDENKEDLWTDISETEGEFRFELELADLATCSTPYWFHLYIYKGNATVPSATIDLNRGPALSIGQEFVFGSKKFIIHAWEGTGTSLALKVLPIE
ncbi:MAG: hypothetical protein J6Q06_01230 [Clostridia bacterium]|nr:hypothetical protein [Clostridia bacterium]